jgi:hypothetical protein
MEHYVPAMHPLKRNSLLEQAAHVTLCKKATMTGTTREWEA